MPARDRSKSKQKLLAELAELRQRLAACEASAADGSAAAEHENAQRYRSFVRDFAGIVYRGTMDFRPIFFHGAVEAITGYREDDFVAGKPRWDEVIHPEDLANIRESVARIRDEPGYATEREYRIIRPDGQMRWVRDVVHNVCDRSGLPVYVQGVLYDVTHRRQAEEALRQSEQDARALLEALPLGVCDLDVAGVITWANSAFQQITGYTASEMVGTHVWDRLAPGPLTDSLPSLLSQLAAEQPPPSPYVCREITKDGRHIDIQVNWTYKRDITGRVSGFVSVVSDITEQKQVLRQSLDELRAVYDGMVDGLLVADVETKRFLRVNRAMCRMLGYSEEEVLSFSVKDIHPPDELARVEETFEAQARGNLPLSENIPVLRKDGSVFYADIAAKEVVYRMRPCVIGFFRDVTQRRRTDEAVRKERQVLRNLLAASDRDRQMVSYEVHEGLTQHLTAAIMHLQVSQQRKADQPDEAEKAFGAGFAMLCQALTKARRLISEMRPPLLDDSGIVAALENLAYESNCHGGPEVHFHSAVDFDRLQPVLENAVYRIVQEGVANARRHSNTDKVRVELVQEGEQLRIEVQDWGSGFDAAEVGEGCYGLEGIRERVRLLGGQAVIDTATGRGTRIRVLLPLAAQL